MLDKNELQNKIDVGRTEPQCPVNCSSMDSKELNFLFKTYMEMEWGLAVIKNLLDHTDKKGNYSTRGENFTFSKDFRVLIIFLMQIVPKKLKIIIYLTKLMLNHTLYGSSSFL